MWSCLESVTTFSFKTISMDRMTTIFLFALSILGAFNLITGNTNSENDAKEFIKDASSKYFQLYNKIAQETYLASGDEDFNTIFMKVETVKKVAEGLVDISARASTYNLSTIQDAETKRALKNLRLVGDLFVLGEEYFTSILSTFTALRQLAADKDNEPYLGGANIPNYDGELLAYYPDIQNIYRFSNDSDELEYYWKTWREKNLLWASVNFYTIIEALQKAAKILDIPVQEFWYRYYDNKDFLNEMEKVMNEMKSTYEQMHAFVRKQLYVKYGSVINPEGPIPDHLFEQVLAQVWDDGSVIEEHFPFSELPPYNTFVQNFDAKEMISLAERFYTSLGFEPLDETFKKEQLREQDASTSTGDCRADIFDLTPQVFMKYCPTVDFRKFLQAHGYMGRVFYAKEKKHLPAYYFNSYDLEYPVGEAVILSASTPKHLTAIGLAKNFKFEDKTLMNRLFRMGIHTIFNIPRFFVHTKVVNDLLNGEVDMVNINKHYWKLTEKYVGVEPPCDRTEDAIDFPYKFYLDIEQNHQTKKFVSEILGYQFHRAFCKKLNTTENFHNCDFYGSTEVGKILKKMMSLGSSVPWRDVIAEILPNEPQLSADALLNYYSPIINWIIQQNTVTNTKIGWTHTQKKIV